MTAPLDLYGKDVLVAGTGGLFALGTLADLLWSHHGQLTLVGVTIVLLNVVALRLAVRIRDGGAASQAAGETNLLGVSCRGLRFIEQLKATGGENEHFRKWAGSQAKMLSGQQQATVLPSVFAALLAAVNSALILLIGGLHADDGHLSIGLLVAFQVLVTAFSVPIPRLTGVAGRSQDFGVEVARLRGVVDRPAGQPVPERPGGRVVFDRVTFGYDPLGAPLLKDFSCSVGPGEQIALVGGSGSGKSAVTRLLSGAYRPWSGRVLVDGKPRDAIPRSVLAASVTFVDQEIFLFEGTVRDNVTLWDPSISDEDVIAALEDAAIYDVVSGRHGGLRGRVEEDGRNFSGGQRQRLEIARALVRNPSVLVLDEATSALDAGTELTITDNVRRRGCACIVIAHRLSAIRDSDEILVLRHGEIAERGTHADLAGARGPYASLIKEH